MTAIMFVLSNGLGECRASETCMRLVGKDDVVAVET